MELSVEQQAEYDKLYKSLVAQGGPLIGKLKAAGHKDPNGVARLIELGWVNPDAEPLTMEKLGFDTSKSGDPVSDLEEAQKASAAAQLEAEEAIKKAEDAKAVAKSKEPPPCSRCGGDGQWHSLKTGQRAKTSVEPLHDPERTCPECK